MFVGVFFCRGGLAINRTWNTHRHEVAAVGSLSRRVEVTHPDVFSNQVRVMMCTDSHAGLRGGPVLHHQDKQAHYSLSFQHENTGKKI